VASPVAFNHARCPDESTGWESAVIAKFDINGEAALLKATLPRDSCDTPSQPPPIYPESPGPHSLLVNLALLCCTARTTLSGVIRTPAFPCFPVCWRVAMESSRQYQVPLTPRVISPSPTPSEAGSTRDGYFGPVTRSATRKQRVTSPPPIDEDSSGSDPDKRARTRSRSPVGKVGGRRRMSALASRRQMNGTMKKDLTLPGDVANGHLSPAAANKNYWREMSRSPSPLGLIPIHQKWRSFVSYTCYFFYPS
jgi:diacylglycerol kinase (CTP)